MSIATAAVELSGRIAWADLDFTVTDREDPAAALAELVRFVANQCEVDVCSVYLLEPDRDHLILAATVGLNQSSVGRVRMTMREGLAGLVAEQVQPVNVRKAADHPRFKFFPEVGEELYATFLGVPLIHDGMLQGVMVVQTIEEREFLQLEVDFVLDAAKQIGPYVAQCRRLDRFIAPVRERLWELARNLWWTWDEESISLFRDLDPDLWVEVRHNPIDLLRRVSMKEVEKRAGQRNLHSRINYAWRRLQEYLANDKTWGDTNAGVLAARPVAYFSAEFGIHESLPIYSGGLGVLAGDHIKSASDLGIPLVGIGLFYGQGYFRQKITAEGWQTEIYTNTDRTLLPLEVAIGKDNEPVVVCVETRSGAIYARVWKLRVGRTMLLLLDADVEQNTEEDRQLTARLYGGNERVRIRQELLLGVGGVRAIKALGIHPGVYHLNEGHSAFATLEVVRDRMQTEGSSFADASRDVSRNTVFTTHTPVPAGHDRFHADILEEHLGPLRDAIGMSYDGLQGLGRVHPHDHGELFCMTVLALKLSQRANGVSSLHGYVSRRMWSCLWPHRSESNIPIGHITNGIHVPSWLAPQMQQLYDKHLGTDWRHHSGESSAWNKIDSVDDGELWETHLTLKSRLIEFARTRLATVDYWSPSMPFGLSPDVLTIGFARRFATYKRASLIMHDIEQLAELVSNPRRPVQIIFAGKAHPKDEPGKGILQQIVKLAKDPRFAGKIVFLEDYDINVGRLLTQGVDVWLNNPRRPLEASGTSGEKVILNGGLNCSILDGWWAEAFDGRNGFAIGTGEVHTNTDIQDLRDATSLLDVVKTSVIPLYYDRDGDGLPRRWIERMKRAICTLGWRFNADRMVMDYASNSYVPAAGGTSCEIHHS